MLASKGGELKTVNILITAGVNVNHVTEVSLAVCTSLYTSRPASVKSSLSHCTSHRIDTLH